MGLLAKIIYTVFGWCLTIAGWIVTPVINLIFRKIYDSKARVVYPVRNEVLLQSATSLAEKIRSRELRVDDVMDAYIARIDEVETQLNAVVDVFRVEALADTLSLDRALDDNAQDEKYSAANMPLLGVPLSVKEAFQVKGMRNSGGLVSRRDFRAEEDCLVIQRLRAAGAIPYCLTNVSELCMWYESSNNLYGRTNNPYNTVRTVGGSSGGEACNIASGGAVIGVGSDIGGSIRMPAFFNGIFGHRPSKGLVPNEGQFPGATGSEEDLLSTGPMCRYAEDLLPMLKVMAGPNQQADLNKQVDLSQMIVYNIVDDGGSLLASKVQPDLRKAQAKVIDYLRDNVGARICTITIPRFRFALDMWAAKMMTSGGAKFCQYMANMNGSVNPFLELIKWIFGKSEHTLPAIALGMQEKLDFLMEGANAKALKGFDKLNKEMTDLFDDNSIIVYPSHPKVAPYHNEPLVYPFNWVYTAIFNALGLPVTQVPLGLNKQRLPLGVQIVAGMNNDRLAIAVAENLARGDIAGWVNPGTV